MSAAPARRGRPHDHAPAVEDVRTAAERRRAARALLRSPVLRDEGGQADDLRLVRRHRVALARLFADGLGYRLLVEPSSARLVKAGRVTAGPGRDDARGLVQRSGEGFTPRAYALCCLTLAALTRCDTQLLVDELVDEVRAVAADAGLDVDLDEGADRHAWHEALLALTDLGVLAEREGDLEGWGIRGDAQSLLEVSRERLRLLLAVPLAGVEGPHDLTEADLASPGPVGAPLAVRRLLAESPLLSTSELTDEQARWWAGHHREEVAWFRDALGLEVEVRAEGAAAVDPDAELTDLDPLGRDAVGCAALLLLDRLVARVRDRDGHGPHAGRAWRSVPAGEVGLVVADALGTHQATSPQSGPDDSAELHLAARRLLESTGLLQVADDGAWLVHAAAARYVRGGLAP